MKLVYQYIAILFNFSTSLNHLHPLQVKNCDSNSRLVVDEDDYGKLRLERVKMEQITRIDQHYVISLRYVNLANLMHISQSDLFEMK